MIHKTKVVSRNFIEDFIATIQNLFGMNLNGYEKMIDKGINTIQKELQEKKIKLKWHRIEISQLTKGAIAIVLYGDEL